MKTSYVFIAGGIGITPYRSIIKSLVEEKIIKDITLFYFVKTADDILFADLFRQAEKEIGLTVIYTIGKRLTLPLLQKYVPDLMRPLYYLSGPQEMIATYRDLLMEAGVSFEQMKMDSFTGYDLEI